jgi:hypothetical protein
LLVLTRRPCIDGSTTERQVRGKKRKCEESHRIPQSTPWAACLR